MSRFGRAQILSMIPHSGSMCLLDEVVDWGGDWVSGLSHCFAAPDNPLRRPDGTLGASCAIEIAAQAMAVHGWLTEQESGPPLPGYLVSLRDVRLGTAYLDAAAGPLNIGATRLTRVTGGAFYNFSVSSKGMELVSGRATVLFGVTA